MLACLLHVLLLRNTLLQQHISPAIPEEESIIPSEGSVARSASLDIFAPLSLMAAQKPPSGVKAESEAMAQNRQSPFQPDNVLAGAE